MKISIIIPTYNEGETISQLLDAVRSELADMPRHAFSIIVVDGTSKDMTRDIVKGKMSGNNDLHLIIEEKKGLGIAYVKGMNHAIEVLGADAFMEFDGDFQHDPRDIRKLVAKLDEGYDHVIGSRYIKDGSIPKEWPWYRKALSSFGNIIIRIGLRMKIHDTTSGFKLTKVSGLKEKLPLGDGDLISLRHAYKIHFLHSIVKSGARVAEVPINFLNRNKGISKSTFEDIIESLKVVWILGVLRGFNGNRLKNKKRVDEEAADRKKRSR